MRDYYSLLGVPKDASIELIGKAYKLLAKKYHPDRNKEPGAVEKMIELNQAWEILSDPDKKKAYDIKLKGPPVTRETYEPSNYKPYDFKFEKYINNKYDNEYMDELFKEFIDDIDDYYEYRLVKKFFGKKKR